MPTTSKQTHSLDVARNAINESIYQIQRAEKMAKKAGTTIDLSSQRKSLEQKSLQLRSDRAARLARSA